jgi:hypothetical protein
LKQCRGDRAFEQALQRLSPQQLERQGEAKAAPRPMSSTSARPPRNEMPAPPEAPLVGDGNELAHRAFLADERRAMALSFHATLISNASRRSGSTASKRGSKPPPRERIGSRRPRLLPLLPQPLQLGSTQPMEPYGGGCFRPNCRFLELRNGNIDDVVVLPSCKDAGVLRILGLRVLPVEDRVAQIELDRAKF